MATSVAITGITGTLTVGESAQLLAVATLADGNKSNLTSEVAWQSANPAIAIVATSGVVTAVAVGTVEIRATHQGITGTEQMVVPSVTSVAISGVRNPMAIGDAEQLTATALLSNNLKKNVTTRAAWVPSDAGVFTISAAGVLTAVGKGLTNIRAAYLGAEGSAAGVVDQPGCTYQVSPALVSFYRGAHTSSSTVTTQPGCAWTVTPDVDWLTIRLGGTTTGVGSGNFSYSVPFVDGPLVMEPRVGHAKVRWDTPTAGQNVEVTQTSDCRLASLGPSSHAFGSDGGSGLLFLTVNGAIIGSGSDPWQLMSNVDWISVPGVGHWGFGGNFLDIHFQVSANPGTSPRVGTIIGCDKTVTVTQAGQSGALIR